LQKNSRGKLFAATCIENHPTSLTVSRVRAANIVWHPCSDSSHVTAPYKLSIINRLGVNVLSAAYRLPL